MSGRAEHRSPSSLERAFYGPSAEVLVPANEAELRDIIRQAEADGRTIVPAGDGAHAGTPDLPPEGALLVSTRAFASVIEYEPDDFTIGLGAGMRLAELKELLTGHGQEIPIDWPAGEQGTVGGLVARAPAGARQGRYGPLSTFVLGARGMCGGGRAFRTGGMVVKNVAGYQIAKLLVGSMGAAGFVLRANFRLRPVPRARRLGLAVFESEEAAWEWAMTLRGSGLEPAALAVLSGGAGEELAARGVLGAGDGPVVAWVFEGNAATVDWLRGEAAKLFAGRDGEVQDAGSDAAASALDTLASFAGTGGRAPDDAGIVRLSVLPSALAGTAAAVRQAFAGRDEFSARMLADPPTGLLAVRWSGPRESIDEPVKALREVAKARDGVGKLLYLPPAVRRRYRHDLRGDPGSALTEIVLRAFDPHKVFVRRRGTPPAPAEATT